MASVSSSVVSTDSGKFKLTVTYSVTSASVTWQAKADITDQFKSKHKYKLQWYDGSGKLHTNETNNKFKTDHTFGSKTNAVEVLKVYLTINGKKASVSITVNTYAPPYPTTFTASKINDAHYRINVRGSNTVTNHAEQVVIERTDTELTSWSQVTSFSLPAGASAYNFTYDDLTTDQGKRYRYRTRTYNSTAGTYSQYVYTGIIYTRPTTDGLSNAAVETVSGQTKIKWSYSNYGNIDKTIVTSFVIYTSRNGAAYGSPAVHAASANISEYERVIDTSGYVDGEYTFAIAVRGSGGDSTSKTECSNSFTTKPNAPAKVSAYQNASGGCTIGIEGTSAVASKVVVYRIVGGTQTQIAEENYPCPVYEDDDAVTTDVIVYAVKFTNDSGESSVVRSLPVDFRRAPKAPILNMPADHANADKSEGTVRLSWTHNPQDGAPQTACQLYINGTIINLEDEAYYDLSMSTMSPGAYVTWKARTKGTHPDWSPWSETRQFRVLTKPEIMFTSPQNADTIEELPITFKWDYSDDCGTLTSLEMDIIKGSENVKTVALPLDETEYTITGVLFENHADYAFLVRAESSTSLRAQDLITVSVEYEEVAIEGCLLVTVEDMSEDGCAYVSIGRDLTEDAEPEDVAAAFLYRVHDGETEYVAQVDDGAMIVDRYAPLNTEYTYELLQLLDDGRVSLVTVDAFISSEYAYAFFGNESARAIWNPNQSVSLGRPEREEVRYSGRKYPVSYDSMAIEEKASFTAVIMERDELTQWRKMIRSGGQGIWKSLDGDVYDADFTFSYTRNQTQRSQMWSCTLDVVRIEG